MDQPFPARVDMDLFCQHGGRIDAARAVFGGDDWIDLSTGIAPSRYPVGAWRESLNALPSPAAVVALEGAAAAAFGGVDPARIVAVPGSDLALRTVAGLIAGETVAAVGPGYGGHVAMWGRTVEHIAAADLAGATGHDCIVLANPNNPDGHRFDRATLLAVAASLARRGGWLIVDEAFADVAPDDSLAAAQRENVVVLRSFGKFYGLPGLRLGFVIAPPAFAASLRARLGDWPVSGPAIAIGTAAYRDTVWQTKQRARLSRAATRLDSLLASNDVQILGGTSLFRLVTVPDATALFLRLARAHILLRPFAGDAQRLRIGLPGEPAHWQRLAAALSQGDQP